MDDHIDRSPCDSIESTNGMKETPTETPDNVTVHQQDDALRACEARFRSLYEHAPLGIVLINAQGTILQSNPALQEILGYSDEELRRLSFADVTHPDDLAAELVLHEQVLAGQRDAFRLNKRYIHKDGRIVWGHLAAAVTRHPDGTPASMIGMLLDVTGQRQAVPPLHQSEERFRVLMEQVTDLVSIVDRAGHYTYVSPSYQTVLGYEPAHLLGRPFFELLHPDDRSSLEAQWPHWLQHASEPGRYEIRVRHADGSWRWLDAQVHPALDEPAIGGLIATARDITERKRGEAELRHLELHDALTGLPNRTLLQERLEQCMLNAKREHTQFALLLLDLNRFSEVNEAIGHGQGDLLLQRLAGRC